MWNCVYVYVQCYSRTQQGDLEGAYESAKQAMKSAGMYVCVYSLLVVLSDTYLI